MGGADLWPSLFEDGRNWSADIRGLPFSMYAPRREGGGQVSYTYPLRISCKKRERGSR